MNKRKLEYFSSRTEEDYFLSKTKTTWFQAYIFSLKNNLNLLVLKNFEDQIKFIEFLMKQKFYESVWVN